MKSKITFLLFCGMCLIAFSTGMVAKQVVANEDLGTNLEPLPKKKCAGSCVDGSSSATPCEYPGRTCNTPEACGCSATGNTTGKLCDCYN